MLFQTFMVWSGDATKQRSKITTNSDHACNQCVRFRVMNNMCLGSNDVNIDTVSHAAYHSSSHSSARALYDVSRADEVATYETDGSCSAFSSG